MDYTTSELTILSAMNWLHLLATVAWIGGIVINVFILSPAAKESLEPPMMMRLWGGIMKRFKKMVYVCMAVFIGTGIVMMFMNSAYGDSFDFGDTWTLFLVIKHVLVLVLIIMGIYMFQGVFPKLKKLAAKGPSPALAKAEKQQRVVATVNLILGILILAATAVNGAISGLV
jgi:uncharacterized membrane protein